MTLVSRVYTCCSTDNITRPSKVHDSLNYHEPGLTNYSFDASAGIITIDWKLNTSDDIDSSDNDVTQHADNGMTGNRRVQKKTRTTDLTRST